MLLPVVGLLRVRYQHVWNGGDDRVVAGEDKSVSVTQQVVQESSVEIIIIDVHGSRVGDRSWYAVRVVKDGQ